MSVSPPIFGNPLLTAVIDKQEVLKLPITIRGRHFVYLLKQKDNFIYIGRTRNLKGRLSIHKNARNFENIYLCEYATYTESCIAERQAINYIQPICNRR